MCQSSERNSFVNYQLKSMQLFIKSRCFQLLMLFFEWYCKKRSLLLQILLKILHWPLVSGLGLVLWHSNKICSTSTLHGSIKRSLHNYITWVAYLTAFNSNNKDGMGPWWVFIHIGCPLKKNIWSVKILISWEW